MSRKNDPEFTKFLLENTKLDESTGKIEISNIYANLCLNFGWKGNLIVVPYSHVVWLLTHKQWPRTGFHIDHVNNVSLDNRPSNLAELTERENQKKRRGRLVYRNYGKTKYGYGINIFIDKRDSRFYVTRYISRGYGDGDLRSIKRGFGGFASIETAELKIAEIIADIKKYGEDYLPKKQLPNRKSRKSLKFDSIEGKMRELRQQGMTFQAIADVLDVKMGVVYRRTRDI